MPVTSASASPWSRAVGSRSSSPAMLRDRTWLGRSGVALCAVEGVALRAPEDVVLRAPEDSAVIAGCRLAGSPRELGVGRFGPRRRNLQRLQGKAHHVAEHGGGDKATEVTE